MKYRFFLAAIVVVFLSACKTTYKATDRPTTSADSTSVMSMDSIAMNKTPLHTDSAINNTEPDSISNQPAPDSVNTSPTIDSSMNTTSGSDSLSSNTQVPASVEAAFNTQYSGAADVEWSAYDSLAAVPIDLRLTGWKKMSPEDHMAKFGFEDETYYAWFDNEGNWIGSAHNMQDYSKLPSAVNAAITNAIKQRYTDYNISQVNRVLQPGKKAYEVELTNADNKVRMMVTAEGKITEIFKYAKN